MAALMNIFFLVLYGCILADVVVLTEYILRGYILENVVVLITQDCILVDMIVFCEYVYIT